MLTFLRRTIFSTVGKIVALLLLAVIAVAFALGDITGLTGGRAPTSDALVEIGGQKVTEADMQARMKNALDLVRQQQPMLDMAQFVNSGGFDQVLADVIDRLTLQEYAQRHSMSVSKATVDGAIASSPRFADSITGKFSQRDFNQFLRQQGLTAANVRDDIRQGYLAQWIEGASLEAKYVPTELVMPYASLMLERRRGSLGFIPITAIDAGAPPTDAELTAFYNRSRARYTVPERRVIRYAVVRPEQFVETSKATDAEIAEAYKRDAAKYAASTRRTFAQVIVADQNAANALAAKVKGGATMAAAAQAAGLKPSTVANAEKAAFARQSSQQIADAAFAAAEGAVVGPLRTQLGWAIVRVEKIEQIAAKPLASVRDEIATAITERKEAEALANMRARLDSAIANNATFDEAVADAKIKAETTGEVLPDGRADGADPTTPVDPILAQVAKAGFSMQAGDDPQLVQAGEGGGFALIKTERIVASAPRPLAQIREQVAADFIADRRLQGARRIASTVLADVGKGTPLADALKKTGLTLPAAQPLDATRAQIAQARVAVPPPVQLMFSMAAKKAKMTEAPNGGGYWVVWLDEIQAGNARGNDGLIAQTRGQLGQMIGLEYIEQFSAAARKSIGVRRNEAAIARLKAQLGGQAQN